MDPDLFERNLRQAFRQLAGELAGELVGDHSGQVPRRLVCFDESHEPGIDPLVFALGFEQDPEQFPGFRIGALLHADVDITDERLRQGRRFDFDGADLRPVRAFVLVGPNALLELVISTGDETLGTRGVQAHAVRQRDFSLPHVRLRDTFRVAVPYFPAFFCGVEGNARRHRRSRRRVDRISAGVDVDRGVERDGLAPGGPHSRWHFASNAVDPFGNDGFGSPHDSPRNQVE